MTTDEQIAKKIIQSVQSDKDWAWVDKYKSSNGWMRNGSLMLKAFQRMSPADPWEYICVYVGGDEWRVPSELRKGIWEAAYPVFERVKAQADVDKKESILNRIFL